MVAPPLDFEDWSWLTCDTLELERWDGYFLPLRTREEVWAYCRHASIPTERADDTPIPLWLTKCGVLVSAPKL